MMESLAKAMYSYGPPTKQAQERTRVNNGITGAICKRPTALDSDKSRTEKKKMIMPRQEHEHAGKDPALMDSREKER